MGKRVNQKHVNQVKKIQLPPTTTAAQCRSSFFLPYVKNQKGTKREFMINIQKTEYKVKEMGFMLTELHRDIIDSIILAKKKFRKTQTGLQILYCLSDVYKILNNRISKTELKEKIQEIRATTFFVQNPSNPFAYKSFNIFNKNEITNIEYSKNKGGRLDGIVNYYYFVEISGDYLDFTNFDLQVFLNAEITREIINIKSAVVKHLVRYCLSQNELNKDLDDILFETFIIDKKTCKADKWKKKKEILNAREYLKNIFFIEIKEIQKTGKIGVFYEKIKQIYFKNPAIQLTYNTTIIEKNSKDIPNLIPATLTDQMF